MNLSDNDMRVLKAIEHACKDWDGFAPHGNPDWVAIKRLEREAFVERSNEYGECKTCPESHETALYTLTVYGVRVLHPVSETLEGCP